MRIGIVGSGISGLTTATHLTAYGLHDITVLEREPAFGGRANTLDGGEHCARLFLSDYDYLLSALSKIRLNDGRSVAEALRPLRRLCRTDNLGWIEISHLYPLLSNELGWRDKLELVRERRRTPILAERAPERRQRRLRLARNLSIGGWIRVIHNVLTRPRTYGFDGPTETFLIRPWVEHLSRCGVEFRATSEVDRIESIVRPSGVRLVVGAEVVDFDAVVVTAFLPDAARLFSRSGVESRFPERDNIHCKCATIQLDPREPALQASGPVLYAGQGISMIVQPDAARCTALCTNFDHPPDDVMLTRIRALLALEHPEQSVRIRTNLQPSEGLYCSNYINPDMVLPRSLANVYLAGSYVRNSYPVDSGEGAARSAFNVVQTMARDYGARLGGPPAAPRRGYARSLLGAHD